MSDPAVPPARVYGRRKGRPLRVRKSQLIKDLLPQLDIKLSPGAKLDPNTLFESPKNSLWIEIGFGGGEHLAGQALRHPSIGFVGCEPFVNGVASLLDHLDRQNIQNVRVFPDDARLLLDALPQASVERCYVLFADPWPKARHAERRFIGPENLPRLARVLKPGGELRLATDDARLADWMLIHMRSADEFEEIYNQSSPSEDWLPTRYEQKAIAAGRAPVYRTYRRINLPPLLREGANGATLQKK